MSEREIDERKEEQPQEASPAEGEAEGTAEALSLGTEADRSVDGSKGDVTDEESNAGSGQERTEEVAATTYDVYLEETAEGATLALILDLPGCFANGATRQQALDNLQESTAAYHAWLRQHDDYMPDVRGPFVFAVKEVFQITYQNDYEINSFFAPDAAPATDDDIEWVLTLLGWQRDDVLARVGALPDEVLDWKQADGFDAWSIRETLDHIAQAEVWYMGRLDETPPHILVANIPGSTIDRLQLTRQAAIMRIKSYPKESRGKILAHQGERWTLRKALRRAVWHERDHLNQIDEMLAAYRAAHS